MRLALYQPEIALNVGALLRVAACFDAQAEIIEPCGFALDDRGWRRAALDYADGRPPVRHASFAAFLASPEGRSGRLLLLSTRGETPLFDHRFEEGDILMTGRETSGAPIEVHEAAFAVIRVPIAAGARSLNVATAAAAALSEARRQIGFPEGPGDGRH
jgi:tRNA (cytidine/uridine-2'-O-)-methyltransferase